MRSDTKQIVGRPPWPGSGRPAGLLPGLSRSLAAVLVAAFLTLTAADRPARAAEPAAAGDAETLARQEAELLRQYQDLERSFLRLADLLASSDPRRAAVLRSAFERARDEEMGDRLGTIVSLLEAGQLLKAGASQEAAVEQFRGLLDLLEEGGRDRNLADTKREVRQFLGRVTKLIARQRDIEGSTEGGGDTEGLSGRQRQTADEASELAGDLGRFAKRIDDSQPETDAAREDDDARGPGEDPAEAKATEDNRQPAAEGGSAGGEDTGDEQEPGGEQQSGGQQQPGGEQPSGGEQEPGGEQPSGDVGPEAAAEEPITGTDDVSRARRTRRLLEAAQRRMQEARQRLEEARRKEARAEQQRAIEELETARAELEEILRQMREEEIERLLVQLETRVRMMLKAERTILASAEKLAAAEAMGPRERQLEAARIGREQDDVTAEAGRAMTLVRDDGSAVAIPEALELVHDDSGEAAGRLTRGDVTPATLGLIGDLVTGLEELLAALEKSRGEQQQQQQAGAGGGRPAEPGEQPLVDRLAELKMLRSLQVRVNARTERFARLLDEGTERAAEPELVAALGRLAERQRAIEQAARDIVAGRTER